jgi:hypothetical protein
MNDTLVIKTGMKVVCVGGEGLVYANLWFSIQISRPRVSVKKIAVRVSNKLDFPSVNLRR